MSQSPKHAIIILIVSLTLGVRMGLVDALPLGAPVAYAISALMVSTYQSPLGTDGSCLVHLASKPATNLIGIICSIAYGNLW